MSKDVSKDQHLASAIEDPFLRRSVKTALHLRRYLPFYVFGMVWLITLSLFPSFSADDNAGDDTAVGTSDLGTGVTSDGTAATGITTVDPGAGAATAGTGAGATAGGAARTGGGTSRASTAAGTAAGGTTAGATTAAISAEQATSAIQRETGKTRLGADCAPGVRQVPGSSYALPCQNVYTGPNGGATFRGVTDKEILLIRRTFPETANSQAVAAVSEQAGYASADVAAEVRDTFIAFFNKAYELYGRQVKVVEYESEYGNSTDEAQSKGKEGACQDADKVIKEIKGFGTAGGSSPFSECMAERKGFVFTAGAYYPESWYRKYHPYLWGTVMECERISYQVSEYIGKRLLNRPAKWAGDATMRARTRYFGTYVPDNDGYQRCVQITRNELKTKYGVSDPGPKYDYQLDISRFPDQAAQAAVQFAAANVTTVILACDYISATVLTAAAERQNWRPEWMTIGTGGTDLDNSARLYNQNQVNGHLFGPSQLGATSKLIGPNSEPGRVYKIATGKTIPDGTDGSYFTYTHIFNLLQAAGPILNGDNLARGAMTIPPSGAPDYAAGFWSLLDGPDGTAGQGDHTEVEDSREVYWVCDVGGDGQACTGSSGDKYYNGDDGDNGTYKEASGGKRYRNNEWSTEEPPIYPPRS